MPPYFTIDDANRVTAVWNSALTPPGDQWLDAGTADPPPTVGSTYDPNAHTFSPSKPSLITSSQFINRFTSTEQLALSTAAARGSGQMMLLLIRLAAAGSVDLTDPEVAGGVNSLIGTILTADRANAILDHDTPLHPPLGS